MGSRPLSPSLRPPFKAKKKFNVQKIVENSVHVENYPYQRLIRVAKASCLISPNYQCWCLISLRQTRWFRRLSPQLTSSPYTYLQRQNPYLAYA
ncbi:MAG: hypothetical protein EZS28_035134 [Streblomastix strix]|uniref:Uncharacterized protein n=1 Tax=Streblomastix strix TaxID=222440 RepID=A0A5J4UFE2_9EUKA|nr:MAG: hypothetical protein EZS28_035134 [Streblomastix strix]